ncbi:MAG: hypothetical protein ACQEVA_07255 [Myxococcota bacterium]
MASESTEGRSTFSDALSSLIEHHSSELSSEELSEVLEEYSEVLASGSLAPDATLEGSSEPFHLRLVYGSPVALERDLNNLLEIQGIVVEIDRDLPALSDLKIDVRIDGHDEAIALNGRPVSKTPAGTALQIAEVDADLGERLRTMPDRARDSAARRADKRRSAEPASGKAAASSDEPTPSRPRDQTSRARPEGPPARRELSRDEPFEADQFRAMEVRSMRDAIIETALRPGLWILDVQSDDRRIQVLITKGQLRDIRRFPRAKTDRLEILLHKAGKLTEEEVETVRHHCDAHGGCAAEALLERAIMSVAEISVAESTRLRFLLERVWNVTPTAVRTAKLNRLPRRCLAQARHALEFAFHLLRDEALERDDLESRCREQLVDKTFRVSENPPFDLSLMSLSPKEKSTIDVLSRAPLRFDDAMRMSVLSKAETSALLVTLDDLGLLDTDTVRTWTRKQTRTMERITMMHSKLDRSTHFDILGVHWSAFGEEIEEAYEQLIEQVSAEALDDEMPPEVSEKAAVVRMRLKEAHDVLSDSRRRTNYRGKVVDQFKLRTSLQMFEKQADTAKMRRDIEGAIDFYRRILELKPGHGDAKRDLEMLKDLKRKKDSDRDRDKSNA